MLKKCLVLGGTGFLGRNLCAALLNNGYKVCIFGKNVEELKKLKKTHPSIEIQEVNFIVQKDFSKILMGVDIVFHLVSTTTPTNIDLLYDFETNVLPTVRFLDACLEMKIKKVIYFSSGGTVYGIPDYIPIDEKHKTEPISAYGMHKLTVEKCLEYYQRMYKLDYQILRISNPYGRCQNPFGKQGVIAIFLSKALMDQSIDIWGDGKIIRDYIFVDDLMQACLKIIDYSGDTNCFNLGTGVGYSLEEIIRIIELNLQKNLIVRYLSARKQDVHQNVLDISLSKKELKWNPGIDLNQGIVKMICMWDRDKKIFREE